MDRGFKDKFSDVVIFILRPFLNFLMGRELKVVATGDVIEKDREPFILISNRLEFKSLVLSI